MGIVKSIFSWKRRKAEEATIAANVPCESAATLLMMLMPDASGIAAYQMHTFSAASQAEDYLQSILRGEIQEGTIMFWGLTWPPSDNSPAVEAEPVVLIRDPKRPGLVYTFSFVDLDSAYDFVRHEVRAGLDLAQTAVYWAAPAEAPANAWGEITVSPNRPPARHADTDAVASSSVPAPHIDEPPSVSVPELAPEEPSAIAEPADKAIEATDISNVIDILQARGLREPESPPQLIDEPETPESAGDETMHIDLGDVFGGRRDPETPTTLEDFRRSRESREANDADAAPEGMTEAPAETVSGIVAAWSNIGAAIDEAIDADVARRVRATIGWRRLTRAFVDAANVRMLVTWRRITQALHTGAVTRMARERGLAKAWHRLTHAFAVAVNVRMLVAWRAITRALNAAAAIHTAHESALADAWGTAARACHQAAESKSGRRAMRLVWARISWTLEEAVYAARLQMKKAAARAWSNAAGALAVAAPRKVAADRGLSTAWTRLAAAMEDAAAKSIRVGGLKSTARERTAEGSTGTKTRTSRKAASSRSKGRSKTRDASKPAAKMRSAVDAQATAMETWRSRESGRFGEKKDPFNSFDSPPGRF